MLMLCQGRYCPCRQYVKGVKHIFYILLIKSESMSTLCQGRYCSCRHYVKGDIVNVEVMSREGVHVDVGYHFLM